MKNGGRIPWSVTAFCETSQFSCLMGRHLTTEAIRRIKGPTIPFGAMVEYHPISAKDLTASVRQESLTWNIPWMRVARGGNLERRHLGHRHWGIGADGRVWNLCKKTQCKGSVNAHEWWKVYIPNRRWNSQTSGGDQVLRTSLLSGRAQTEEKNKVIFKEKQTDLRRVFFNPIPRLIVVWWWSDNGCLVHFRKLHIPSSRRTQSQNVRAERRNITYSTEIYRRYRNYRHILGCNAGEKHRRLLEYWWVKRFVWFTSFTILDEKPPDGYTRSGGRLTRKQTIPRADSLWPEIWKDMSEASKRNEKQKWAIEKPKLDNTRRLRGIYFIDPADEEFKQTIKKCAEKVRSSDASSLARPEEESTGRIAPLVFARQNTHASLKPTNLRESVWKGLYMKIDQDDHWRQTSNNETCIQNPQSCSWPVIWQNQFGSEDSNQIC